MNITVEYINTAGITFNQNHRLSRLAFAKHFAIAGQGYAPRPQKLIRTISMFFHYSYYLQKQAFDNNHFSSPPVELSDPTEKGQFSNLAGKGIADFLSKRIDQSIFTVNYEAAMRLRNMPINVQRPDLLAFNQNSMFALEAKGFSARSVNMTNAKNQSLTGGIPVNFTVACASYNLYDNVNCKYHDPFNDSVSYDNEMLTNLTKSYYSGLSEFLNQEYFRYREFNFQGEEFYEVELNYRNYEKLLPYEFKHFFYFEIFEFYRPRLILPKKIQEYAEHGITNETKPFIFESKEKDDNIYIDNDRVGLRIR